MVGDGGVGNPDGALCEAVKMEGGGATAAAAAGAGDGDKVVDGLAKGGPNTDVGFPWSPMFDTIGTGVDAPKAKKTYLVLRSLVGLAPRP